MRTLPALKTLTFPCLEKLKPSEPLYSLWGKNYNCYMLLAVFSIIMKNIPLKTS